MIVRAFCTIAALAVAPMAASAASIGFDGQSHGDYLDNGAFDFGGGLTGVITTVGGVNRAQVYDTGFVGGRDPDLEAPTNTIDGTVYPDGNVLIVAENNLGGDAADDNAGGGTITFVFDKVVRFTGITLIDAEHNGNEINVFAGGTQVVFDGVTGDDEWLRFGGFKEDTTTITVELGGSGAFDSLEVNIVPLPASALLLLGGVLGFAGLRRKIR